LGTSGADSTSSNITATENKDIILARGGDDVIDAAGGDDKVIGGGGDDILIGGAGEDKLVGNADDDILIGGAGKDKLIGKAGDDVLIGGGDGSSRADSRVDIMKGGSGADIFVIKNTDFSIAGGPNKFVKIKDFSVTEGDQIHFGTPSNAVSAGETAGDGTFTFASITQENPTSGDYNGDLLIFNDLGGTAGSYDNSTDELIAVVEGIEFQFEESDITVNTA